MAITPARREYLREYNARRRAAIRAKNGVSARHLDTSRLVYFLSDNAGFVKIGVSGVDRLEYRISQLQQGNARELTLLTTTPGGELLERELHARFADDQVRGEWFRYSDAIREYLSGN